MKFNFGKHNGKDFSHVLKTDTQYIVWAINNIPEFKNKLSNSDKELCLKRFFTYDYLSKKYPNLHYYTLKELIDVLKKEDIVKSFSNGAYGYTIHLTNGGMWNSSNGCDGIELFDEYLEKDMASSILTKFFIDNEKFKKYNLIRL